MQAGDVVWVKFPYSGTARPDKLHPALVLDVKKHGVAVLAYGTSKHVDTSNPRPEEVVVSDGADLTACGLSVPTRFVISERATMFVRRKERSGSLPERKYKQLYRAAVYCGLLQA